MKNNLYKRLFVSCIFLITIFPHSIISQELNIGADIVNRYIWRGLDIASTPSLQPTLEYANGGFDVGFWGAYTLSNLSFDSDEIDFNIGYNFVTDYGNFGLGVVDYYFPNSGTRLSDFKDGEGSNTLEGIFTYEGNDSFPITLTLGFNFYNDPGYNSYIELAYSTSVGQVDLNLFAGATPGSEKNPEYYGTKEFAFINVGFTASKAIKITEDFSLPIFTSFIINPNNDIAHLVFGIII